MKYKEIFLKKELALRKTAKSHQEAVDTLSDICRQADDELKLVRQTCSQLKMELVELKDDITKRTNLIVIILCGTFLAGLVCGKII